MSRPKKPFNQKKSTIEIEFHWQTFQKNWAELTLFLPILAAILVSKMAAVGQKNFFSLFFNSAHQDLSADTKYVKKTLFF